MAATGPAPQEIDITGVDLGMLVAALYKEARPRRAGLDMVGVPLNREMTPEEGREFLEQKMGTSGVAWLDYIHDRRIAIAIDVSRRKLTGDVWGYDREALGGYGTCARIVADLRGSGIVIESVDQKQISGE